MVLFGSCVCSFIGECSRFLLCVRATIAPPRLLLHARAAAPAAPFYGLRLVLHAFRVGD